MTKISNADVLREKTLVWLFSELFQLKIIGIFSNADSHFCVSFVISQWKKKSTLDSGSSGLLPVGTSTSSRYRGFSPCCFHPHFSKTCWKKTTPNSCVGKGQWTVTSMDEILGDTFWGSCFPVVRCTSGGKTIHWGQERGTLWFCSDFYSFCTGRKSYQAAQE